jgi:hypothetical protein
MKTKPELSPAIAIEGQADDFVVDLDHGEALDLVIIVVHSSHYRSRSRSTHMGSNFG